MNRHEYCPMMLTNHSMAALMSPSNADERHDTRSLEDLLQSRPWDTATFRILQVQRRWLVMTVGLPLGVFLYPWLGTPLLAGLLACLALCDMYIARRAWDRRVSESDLVRAAVQETPVSNPPISQAAQAITRQGLFLGSAYCAACVLAASALWLDDSESLRHFIGPVFVAIMAVLSIATAAFISMNATTLAIIRGKGHLHQAARQANIFAPLEFLAPLAVLPKKIRRDVIMLILLILNWLFNVSLHSLALKGFLSEPKIDIIIIAAGLFILQVIGSFMIVMLPLIYMAYRSKITYQA
jgi:hypothetical protein